MGEFRLSIRILSMNVRGLRSPMKWRYIKDLIRKEGIKMVCLHEVKIMTFSMKKCCQLWGDNDIRFFYSEPINGVGGILTIWHNKCFQCTNHIINRWFIVFIRCIKEKNTPVAYANVYSSCNVQVKRQMWEDLKDVRQREFLVHFGRFQLCKK